MTMYAPLPSANRRSRPRSPAAAQFGLAEDDRKAIAAMEVRNIEQVAAIWPLTLSAQVLACALLILIGLFAPPAAQLGALVPLIGAHAAILLLVSLGLLGVLRLPALRRYRAAHRSRLVTMCVVPIAALLVSMLWTVARMPAGPLQGAGFAAALAATIVTGLGLHSIRIATLGFGGGVVLALAVLAGIGPALGVAVLALAGLAVIIQRLAAFDRARAIDQAGQARRGDLAVRMIAEFESTGTGWFWETDRQGRITYLSAKVITDLGLADDAIGQPLTTLFAMDSDTPDTERTLAFHISSRTSFSDYSVCAASNGGTQWWSMSGRPVVDDLGRFQGFIGSGSDLTEKRKSDAEITRLALFDGLTGLANRQRMRLSLDKTLVQQAGPYRATSLFLMDLDRFKAVNDTLGHQAGDALLKQVAGRLQRGIGDAGLVGRLGGDEFKVVLPGIDNRESLSALASDLIASLSQPYFISGTVVTIGCSIGIAVAPQDGDGSETLIRNADLALYAAKADGRGVFRFYSNDMLAGAQTRKLLEDDLRAAVSQGAFHLSYQPVVSTKTTPRNAG